MLFRLPYPQGEQSFFKSPTGYGKLTTVFPCRLTALGLIEASGKSRQNQLVSLKQGAV